MYARLRCGGNFPLPRPGVDRPLRGNCHPLSCAPDNQVRCVFGSAPYQKPPSTVRNVRAVRRTGSCGTRRIFRGTRCAEQASVVRKGHSVHENPLFLHGRCFQRNSVLKIGFYGTEGIFGTGNALLRYGMHLHQRPAPQNTDSTDCGQPPGVRDAFSEACRAKSSPCRTGRIFSARNGPRSDVSRHKKRVTSKSIKTF